MIDLKPYLKEIESLPDARSGWTDEIITQKLDVLFECECSKDLQHNIKEILSLDPRPRFHEDGYKVYGSRIFDVDVRWVVENNTVIVKEIVEEHS